MFWNAVDRVTRLQPHKRSSETFEAHDDTGGAVYASTAQAFV